MAEGYVYILINASLQQDMLKIGKTTRNPAERAKELSIATGVPSEYYVAYEEYVPDCDEAEKMVHDKLSIFRVSDNREFFKLNLKDAIAAVHDVAEIIGNIYGNPIVICDNVEVSTLDVSRDGSKVITNSQDQEIVLWDINVRSELFRINTGKMLDAWSVRFSPDGKYVLTGHVTGALCIWDISTQELIFVVRDHDAEISSVAYSSGGQYLVSGSWDRFVKLRYTKYPKQSIPFNANDWVSCVGFSRDSRFLVAGTTAGEVIVWSIIEQKKIASFSIGNTVESVKYSLNDDLIIATSLRKIVIYDFTKREIVYTLENHQSWVTDTIVLPDNAHVISSSESIKIWNLKSGNEVSCLDGYQFVTSLGFDSVTLRLISGGSDGVRLWDLQKMIPG